MSRESDGQSIGAIPAPRSAFVVLHVPHSSTTIPPDVRAKIALSDIELDLELLRMTDWHTDQLFSELRDIGETVTFPVSRLVVDPERFVDDMQEPMSARGMGVVYTRTFAGGRLREAPSREERADLLARFYWPHHVALTQAVSRALRDSGTALVVDCHSFPSRPLHCDLDQSPSRPEICIGTDDYHTPSWLQEVALETFERAGYKTSVNAPFNGALVPREFLGRNRAVLALMIEVNRSLYLDEVDGIKLPSFERVAADVRMVVRELVSSARDRSTRLSTTP